MISDRLQLLLNAEEDRQKNVIELIASENYVSDDVMTAVGSCLTNKYAEGYPGNRYYGGCQFVDEIEKYCQEQWKKVFNTDYHVNVQPHSGSQANLAVYFALLNPGDTILSMDLNSGGHLSHGMALNVSGKTYKIIHYGLDKHEQIDYIDLFQKIVKYKPKMVIAGASSYSREIDFEKIKELIDSAWKFQDDAYPLLRPPFFMVDMAHIAGLVATGFHNSPFGIADVITTTTHKTLRGPRGALIFCKEEIAKQIDSAVFPGTQGGPLMHVIAGKAVCADEALTNEYREYIKRVVENSRAMSEEFKNLGYHIVSCGTDNHMFLIDLSKTFPRLSGLDVQKYLEKNNITVNKNMVYNDSRTPKQTSGIRIGTAAMTTRGWNANDFIRCANKIDFLINNLSIENKE